MAKRRSGKRAAGGAGTGNRPVSRRQVQAGTVTRVGGKKTRRVVAGSVGSTGTGKGSFAKEVKVGQIAKMPGVKFRDKSGKRISRVKATTKKGNMKSGVRASWNNRGRTGTRRSEVVGGGQKP